MLDGEALADLPHLGVRPAERHTARETGEQGELPVVARQDGARRSKRGPEVGVGVEPRRHHPDHGHDAAVERDGAAGDGFIAPERAAPQFGADDDGAGGVAGGEHAAGARGHAEQREEIRFHAAPRDAQRTVAESQHRAQIRGERRPLERLCAGGNVARIGRRHRHADQAAGLVGRLEKDDAPRVGINEGGELDRLDETEHCRIRADAERE